MKKALSLLLAIVMVFGLMPMAVFADGKPTISFETTFKDTMTVGDTFTVAAYLANNELFTNMTLSLKWNEDALKFNGFDVDRRGAMVTEVFTYSAPVVNQELGIVAAADPYGYDTNGKMFTANFEIIGSGDLNLGLKDADATEFEISNGETDIDVTIDYSAISGLSVAAPEPEGPEIPEGAPFTTVTTDVDYAVAVEDCGVLAVDPWGGMPVEVPYYHITIPAGATEAYVRFDGSYSAFQSQTASDGTPEIGSAWAGVNDAGTGMAGLAFEDKGNYTNVIIPLEFNADPWGAGDMKSTLKTADEDELYYAVGPQDANANTIAVFSLEYDSEDGEDTYAITINQPTGGTVSVMDANMSEITKAAAGDLIFLANEPNGGYQFKHYLIDGVEVTEAELGMANGFYQMPGKDITLSAVFEALHTCTYDQEVPEDQYFVSEATCQHGATYYMSCECGLAGTDTFYSGETVGHVYENGVCKWCGEAATEPILSFTAGGQTLEAVTAEDYCSEYEVTAQKLTVTVPAGVNTVTINCAASMCAYIDHVSSDLSPSGKSAEIDLTQDLTFVCVPVTLDDGSDAYYHVYFEQEAGDVDPEPEDPAVTPGYRFATSADVSAENGGTAVVHVKITGHSNPEITTYNAYDLTLTYDNTKLEFVSGVGADSGDQIRIEKKGDNQIQIVGVGDAKGFDVEVATLTFKTLAEGSANVTIDKVQVSEKKEAVNENIPAATPQHKADAPEADETPNVSVIVVPYTVSKPGFISGNDKILHGESYTFWYTDTTNYTYSELKVTVGGTEVTPTEENGVYTIENVTGAIVITATQTAKTYNVTVVNGGATVNAPETATYGEVYAFTVEASEGKDIDTVKVTKTDDAVAEISYTINENGEYEIAGTDITADFTITVTQKEEPVAATTTITFTGVEAAEVEGGLTQTATVGQDFTFRLNKVEGFTYTAKVGQTDLAETAATETTPAFFTIPADLVVEGGVTVTIAKTEIRNLKVEVSPYFNTDGATMFLVIAKDGEKVLSYGEEVMFYSSRYALTDEEAGAYCWLVSSSEALNSTEAVKAAAEAAINTADATVEAPSVAYDCDVNQTIKVDVNDAQLAYDMYKGEYLLSDSVTMDKFLEADMSTDKKLDVNDVAAIINIIVNGNNS